LIALRDSVRLTRWPLVTIALISANVIVYVLAINHGGSIIDGPAGATTVAYGAIPYEFAHLSSHCALGAAGFSQNVLCSGQAGVRGTVPSQPATWQTAFTSMFVHKNVLAILIAMAFLAVFGATLEDALGRLRFLALYILGGLAALGLTIAANPGSVTPALGASGAVAAVLGGYLVLYPRVGVLMTVVPLLRKRELPAWAVLVLWLALELVLGVAHVITPAGTPATAVYCTQIGGFAFGLLTVRAFAAGKTLREPPRPAHSAVP
jgi:membrane associated rhomboid family serine protease